MLFSRKVAGTEASVPANLLTYVKEVLVPQQWSGACVVMDNLPAHKAAAVREAIASVGARVEFLSPYSPDFNPLIELLV